MKLMKDTCSLMNYLMVNDNLNVKVGDTFAELMWSDRTLWQVTRIEGKKIYAKRVKTKIEDWTDGTQYPVKDENGNNLLWGGESVLTKPRKYWKKNGCTVHLSWGETTGYRDPSF